MDNEEQPQDNLKRMAKEYQNGAGESIDILKHEKEKLLEILAQTVEDNDLSKDSLKATITQLDKTIGLIESVKQLVGSLMVGEEE